MTNERETNANVLLRADSETKKVRGTPVNKVSLVNEAIFLLFSATVGAVLISTFCVLPCAVIIILAGK